MSGMRGRVRTYLLQSAPLLRNQSAEWVTLAASIQHSNFTNLAYPPGNVVSFFSVLTNFFRSLRNYFSVLACTGPGGEARYEKQALRQHKLTEGWHTSPPPR